jgi:hypothetical protein
MLETDGRRSGPAIVVLVEDVRTPLPCDAVHIDGDVLIAALDGRPHRWDIDEIYSVKFLGRDGALLTRSRNPSWQKQRGPHRLSIDEARAMFKLRPPSLWEER